MLQTTGSYQRHVLTGCHFGGGDFCDVDFSRKVITNCRFSECDLTDCSFEDPVISGTIFEKCPGLTAAQIKSTWNFRNDCMETVTLPPDIAEQLLRE